MNRYTNRYINFLKFVHLDMYAKDSGINNLRRESEKYISSNKLDVKNMDTVLTDVINRSILIDNKYLEYKTFSILHDKD